MSDAYRPAPGSDALINGRTLFEPFENSGQAPRVGPTIQRLRLPHPIKPDGASIDIGRRSPAFPVTPPYIRVRIRRFGGLSDRLTRRDFSQLITSRRAFDCAVRRKRFDTSSSALRASPISSVGKARVNWLFSHLSLMSSAADSPLLLPCSCRTVQAFIPPGTTMPSADSSRPVWMNHSILSLAVKTDERPPKVSSTAFSERPPDLQPAPLMETDFANPGSDTRKQIEEIFSYTLFSFSHTNRKIIKDYVWPWISLACRESVCCPMNTNLDSPFGTTGVFTQTGETPCIKKKSNRAFNRR